MTTCVQNIPLVAVIFIAALCFAFIERMVAFFGYVSFAEVFTGTFRYDCYGKSVHFHRSIVESDMILQTCSEVGVLIQFKITLTFLKTLARAVITVYIENTCGNSMMYLVAFSKVDGGGRS